MYHVYATQDLHRHQAAEIAREAELMRRIAERSGGIEPTHRAPSFATHLVSRLRTAFVHHPHAGRPVLGG